MGIGVLFAVDETTVKQIESMETAERPEYISEKLEELYFEEYPERTCELDRFWEAMHRAFTDGGFCFDCGEYPLGKAILGGKILYFDGEEYDDYIITAKNPDEVKAVYKALSALSETAFKKGYNKIDPGEYEDKGREDYENTLEYLQDSIPFWRFAAEHGLWVLFTADQ
jgi:hypothetical protein